MKIRIVKAESSSYWYADKIGEVFEVTEDGFDGGYFVRYNGEDDSYHVSTGKFEIVGENETEAVGMNNGIIEQMQADLDRTKDELAELKTKVAALEGKRFTKETDVRKATAYDFFHGKHFDKVKSPQEIRDDIVAQAKRDVEDLKSEWNVRDDIPGGKLRYIRGQYVCNEEFIVNREKRTVVCLLRWKYDNSLVSKGIAKCDPSDCFNVHVGKAIALRRALGLEVPAEYYSAPQPTEARVGDVIALHNIDSTYKVSNAGLIQAINGQIRKGIASIIDDSRDTCPQ